MIYCFNRANLNFNSTQLIMTLIPTFNLSSLSRQLDLGTTQEIRQLLASEEKQILYISLTHLSLTEYYRTNLS